MTGRLVGPSSFILSPAVRRRPPSLRLGLFGVALLAALATRASLRRRMRFARVMGVSASRARFRSDSLRVRSRSATRKRDRRFSGSQIYLYEKRHRVLTGKRIGERRSEFGRALRFAATDSVSRRIVVIAKSTTDVGSDTNLRDRLRGWRHPFRSTRSQRCQAMIASKALTAAGKSIQPSSRPCNSPRVWNVGTMD